MRARLAVACMVAVVARACGSGGAGAWGAGTPGPDAHGSPADSLVEAARAWPVMGTMFEAVAWAPDSASADAALETARREVFRVDSLMSTWKPQSELSRVNAAAGSGAWTPVSGATAEVLGAALEWAARTRGAFDPTIGPLVDAWGFHGGTPRVPPPARLDSLRSLVGWRKVEVDRSGGRVRVRLPREGMELDFGGIAKGYALDRAVRAMREGGAAGGMVDLGGNVSAFGPPPAGVRSWRFGIRHPREPERLLGTIEIRSGSVATSANTERFFEIGGVRYGHLLDPRTGRPARGVLQVTVATASGTDADAAATAMFVLAPEEGRRLLARHLPRATAVWVVDPEGGRIGSEHVVVAGPGSEDVTLDLE